MTPAEVIVAATSTSAELMGVADAGTVAEGKSADFLVLDANPLEDITNTRRISAVYLRGTAVDREVLSARWTGTRQARRTAAIVSRGATPRPGSTSVGGTLDLFGTRPDQCLRPRRDIGHLLLALPGPVG